MYNIYMQKTITKFLILTIILTAALSVNYLFAAWVGPTQAPPDGNTSTPIHVGSTNQVKEGGLSVEALSVFGSGYFQGNVGIGVVTPTETLDISGGVKVGNTTNTNAGTIRWTGADFQGYMGGDWVSLTGAGLVCTSFTYSAWGECQSNNTQTRTVLTSSPSGCVGGNPITTQSCTYVLPMSTQCANAGGSWEAGQSVCYFSDSSCASGWSPKNSYSSTLRNSCSSGGFRTCGGSSCSTSQHFRQNSGTESCTYRQGGGIYHHPSGQSLCQGGGNFLTCSASRYEIGCTKN